MNVAIPATADPLLAARDAGLRYVSDDAPGLRRLKRGKGFRYVDAGGAAVRDRATLGRIRSLAIPPAWIDVWICPDPNGHLQATGRDARGRKQYRYHPRWRRVRDESKYDRMAAFGHVLPRIRRRVAADLKLTGLPREKVLATVVKLLEATLIRVGNDEYARQNRSYGLTTMRERHVAVTPTKVIFRFRGKSGREHEIELADPRVARIVKKCRDLPGQELFQYVDGDGQRHSVGSGDVNDYLREVSGEAFTSKDFRTWAGTVNAAAALAELAGFASNREARKNIVAAVEQVSERLGNTPAVCRKCYIHPTVFDRYLDGTLAGAMTRRTGRRGGLDADERSLLALLSRRLRRPRLSGRGKAPSRH